MKMAKILFHASRFKIGSRLLCMKGSDRFGWEPHPPQPNPGVLAPGLSLPTAAAPPPLTLTSYTTRHSFQAFTATPEAITEADLPSCLELQSDSAILHQGQAAADKVTVLKDGIKG